MPLDRVTDLPPLPIRDVDSHKGSFGRVLLIAGSRGMSGAACLAGMGALRGGAGLVFVAIPNGITSVVAGREPSYLTIPLPEDEAGCFSAAAIDALQSEVTKPDVIAAGPGCGQSAAVTDLITWLYRDVPKPLVVDADGLNALAQLKTLPPAAGPRVLTPHPGEFARLTGTDIKTVQQSRETMAAQFAAEDGCVVLLKGAGTVITDGRRLAVNTTGNSGMATGGSGDVLTGLIAALLAQGMPPFEAAQLAAHLHGLAGDLAAAQLSQPALIASDLPAYLPAAWLQLSSK